MFLLGTCTTPAWMPSATDLNTPFNTCNNTWASTGRTSPEHPSPSTDSIPMEEVVRDPERRAQQVLSEDGSAGRATSAIS